MLRKLRIIILVSVFLAATISSCSTEARPRFSRTERETRRIFKETVFLTPTADLIYGSLACVLECSWLKWNPLLQITHSEYFKDILCSLFIFFLAKFDLDIIKTCQNLIDLPIKELICMAHTPNTQITQVYASYTV